MSRYEQPLVIRNGLTLPILCYILSFSFLFLGTAIISYPYYSVESIILRSLPALFPLLDGFILLNSSLEFRENELTVRERLFSRYIPIESISKIEIHQRRLCIYFNNGSFVDSVSIYRGILKDNQALIVQSLSKRSSQIEIVDNDNLFPLMINE